MIRAAAIATVLLPLALACATHREQLRPTTKATAHRFYEQECAECHGIAGGGEPMQAWRDKGVPVADWTTPSGGNFSDTTGFGFILGGFDCGTGCDGELPTMPAFDLTDVEVAEMLRVIRCFTPNREPDFYGLTCAERGGP